MAIPVDNIVNKVNDIRNSITTDLITDGEMTNFCNYAQDKVISNIVKTTLSGDFTSINILRELVEQSTITANLIPWPSGYYRFLGASVSDREVEWVDNHELYIRLQDPIATPSDKYPIICDGQDGTGLQLYPITLTSGILRYVKDPSVITYTTGGVNGNFDLAQEAHDMLIKTILQQIAINTYSVELLNLAGSL